MRKSRTQADITPVHKRAVYNDGLGGALRQPQGQWRDPVLPPPTHAIASHIYSV